MTEQTEAENDPDLPDFSKVGPEMLDKICSTMKDHHEYLNQTLASYRSSASMLVGFCAPASIALMLYGLQAELVCVHDASLWMAITLMIAALCAALGMWMVKWGTHGQMPSAWFRDYEDRLLTPEEIVNTNDRILSFVFGSAEEAKLNEKAMKKVGEYVKCAIIIATVTPAVGIVTLLISSWRAAP